MKFKIRHESRVFSLGICIPWLVAIAAFLIFVFLGFNIKNVTATIILIRISALCCVAEILFIILFLTEKIFGAKIIIENDHVAVKMLLRRRKLYFDMIDHVKYTHYEIIKSQRLRYKNSKQLFERYIDMNGRKTVRSELNFHLITGKVFSLNDDATGYEYKRKLWITNPEIDPDEDVKLYQAYQCYCHSYRQYYNIMETVQDN
jgi:membrane-bound ClpP family serine protease